MNERIRELAEQAEKWICTTNFEGMPEDNMTYDELYNKKFAELIVRECGKWVNDNLGLLDEEAEADLLKHFGVEE